MPQPSNTFSSFDAVGNREDLSDIIYMDDPEDTPFMTSIGRDKATNKLHEWQKLNLAAPSTSNVVIEGDDASTDAVTATVRLSNSCQISDKVARVSGTQQAITHAGRDDELAFAVVNKAKELRRDVEAMLLENSAEVTGSDTQAIQMGSVLTWFTTNVSRGTNGSSGGLGNTIATDGDQRNLTENLLKDVILSTFQNGGDPDCIMCGPAHKQVISTFTGNATRNINAADKKLVTAIDIYDSDFGDLAIIPNRFMRGNTIAGGAGIRDVLVLQKNRWAVAYLRPFSMWDLAKTGDSERKQILAEYTLVSRNEQCSGVIADLNY